ncbi:MAG: hypothetical protein WAU23_00645, partial [Ferruginibacter sp.]
MLHWIVNNKYKLMACIIGLYLLVDVLQHKGQTRVLFPKKYPANSAYAGKPLSKAVLDNSSKDWKKGINTKAGLQALPLTAAGFETDVYFDAEDNHFDVHHDQHHSTGLNLESLLEIYQKRKLTAAIWLDIKNLNNTVADSALHSLIQLRTKFNLHQKILVESQQASVLTAFSDSGFYTSCYVPMF